MTEATLKSALVKELRTSCPFAVVLRHEDKITSGIPDMSFTDGGSTSWWEAKLANPGFKSKGIQELMMLRLGRRGKAFYIIWDIPRDFTFIVQPPDLSRYYEGVTQIQGMHPRDVAPKIWGCHDNHR